MFGKHLLQLARRQPVAGDIDDVISARHDVEIPVLILVAGVAGLVITREGGQVFLDKGFVGTPHRRQAGWRQRQLHRDRAKFIRRPRRAILGEDVDLIARHRHRGRPKLDRQCLDPDRIGADRPACLGLPPMVDHRHAKLVLRPDDGVGVGPFAGQEQVRQRRGIVGFQKLAIGVGALDRPERRRRGEQHLDAMIPDHPPEDAGIGRSNRLALKQHGRTTGDERRVDDVGMADNPADIGCGPIDVAGIDVIDVRHRPLQRHRMAAIVAHHPLRLAGGSRSIEDIERIGRPDRHRRHLIDTIMGGVPFKIAPGHQIGRQRLTLVDHAGCRLVRRQFDRLVKERLVGDNPVRLMPAGRADNGFRGRIVDALGKFGRGKAAKDNRMHRAKTRASQHRHDSFGDHRHVDDHPVTGADAKPLQHAGKSRRSGLQLGIGQGRGAAGDRRVIDDRLLLAPPGGDMPVDGIVTGVHFAIREPAMKWRPR